jgi:hypothetical protein
MKWERLWKKTITGLSQHLLGGTEIKPRTSVRIAGLRAEIRTWDFPNMNQECHKVDHDVLFGHGESMINNFFIT